MKQLFKHLDDVKTGKSPSNKRRSDRWPTVRKHFITAFPLCAVCGGKKKLEVHHIMPFHLKPELELEPTNLITLCENDKDGVNCHLLFGHLGNFKSFNQTVKIDAQIWAEKISKRPKGNE